uniref:Uncharacterized protein n=1 Tax=Arundo donax TaxID=35708 RepID=A0A0A9A9N7_ARUDO
MLIGECWSSWLTLLSTRDKSGVFPW